MYKTFSVLFWIYADICRLCHYGCAETVFTFQHADTSLKIIFLYYVAEIPETLHEKSHYPDEPIGFNTLPL